jgi:hypothetical protein
MNQEKLFESILQEMAAHHLAGIYQVIDANGNPIGKPFNANDEIMFLKAKNYIKNHPGFSIQKG